MKKLDLVQSLQLLGTAGVIVGILLLVYELAQNREMVRAQTRSELASELIGLTSSLWDNQQFSDVHRRGNLGEGLTPAEDYQFNRHYFAVFRYFENVHYQYRQGLYDESEFSAHRASWETVMSAKLVAEIWCDTRESFSAEFRADIDSLLAYTC